MEIAILGRNWRASSVAIFWRDFLGFPLNFERLSLGHLAIPKPINKSRSSPKTIICTINLHLNKQKLQNQFEYEQEF
jgi:hypothetical protein